MIRVSAFGATLKLLLALVVIGVVLVAAPVQAVRSIVVEAEGSACTSKGNAGQKQEDEALNGALKKAPGVAAEHLLTREGLKGTSQGRELAAIYGQGSVRGLQEIRKERYRSASGQRCVRTLIRAEITPDEKRADQLQALTAGSDGLLDVQVWPERQSYSQGEDIFFFLKGNKPFFANVVYTDAADNIVQILPNAYRKEAFFEPDKAHRLPQEEEFIIKVAPPAFGTERITVYAATVPLHELAAVVPTGVVNGDEGAARTNKGATDKAGRKGAVEYVEVSSTLTTRQRD